MLNQPQLALFTLLGQTAQKAINSVDDVKPNFQLLISNEYDLSVHLPDSTKRAAKAAESYMFLFVFEEYLRELIANVLSEKKVDTDKTDNDWWKIIPPDIQQEVEKLEEKEEVKKWMSFSPRGKMSLLTLPQLLKIIDDLWKEHFIDVLMDKSLISQARVLVHTRNTICHMTSISEEENNRIKQVMRDWFRIVAP